MKVFRVLNLYAGIGGNRKRWPEKILTKGEWHVVKVTAVELNPIIAKIYKDFFPDDTIIIADAHQYLLEHFKKFDFIWASPPCQTHSRLYHSLSVCSGRAKPRYADMGLYQEIILLRSYFKGDYVIENVIPYYKPVMEYTFRLQRHFFWSNKIILQTNFAGDGIEIRGKNVDKPKTHGFDLSAYDLDSKTKRTILRNCTSPEIGEYIFNRIMEQQ